MTLNTTSLSFRQEYHLLLFWVNCNVVKNLITNYTVGAGDTLQLFPPPPQWLTRHERGGWLGMENLCWLGTENLKGWLTRHGKNHKDIFVLTRYGCFVNARNSVVDSARKNIHLSNTTFCMKYTQQLFPVLKRLDLIEKP